MKNHHELSNKTLVVNEKTEKHVRCKLFEDFFENTFSFHYTTAISSNRCIVLKCLEIQS